MQRHHNSGCETGPYSRGGFIPRRRSASSSVERPRLSQPQQPPVAGSTKRMNRSKSYGSGSCGGDVKPTQKLTRSSDVESLKSPAASECYVQSFRSLSTLNRKSPGVLDDENDVLEFIDITRSRHMAFSLPFGQNTRHDMKSYSDSNPRPPPAPTATSSRSSQMKNSPLPRRNFYSKGINVHPPPRRRLHQAQIPEAAIAAVDTASPSSPPPVLCLVGVGGSLHKASSLAAVALQTNDALCPSTPVPERSVEDAAVSRLRELCMYIIQSAREGTSPPPRAEIKEVVAQYHRSRNHPISPRDSNFSEIPSEFSEVLTYGLARSQNVAKARPRSKFSEIKDEWDYPEDSRLYSTIMTGPSDDVASCVSLPSTLEHTLD